MRLQHSFTKSRAVVTVASPQGELTTVPYRAPDDTGFMSRVSPVNGATANATIYACIALLSAAVADSEFRVLTPVGTRLRAETRLMVGRTWYWRVFTNSLLTHGNAYAAIGGNGALLPAIYGSSRRMADGTLRHDVTLIDGRMLTGLSDDQCFHVHLDGYDGAMSPSPIVCAARMALGLGSSAASSMSADLAAGMRARIVLELHPELSGFTDEQRGQLTAMLQEGFSGIAKRGEIPVLPAGIKAAELGGPSAVDLQIIELMRWSVEDICRVYRVPPRMVGAHAENQRTGSAFEAQATQFIRNAVRPLCNLIAGELSYQLFAGRLDVELDPSRQAMGSFGERVNAVDKAVAKGGVLTIDEGREVLGYGPRPGGEGDRLLSPTGAPDQREGQNNDD